MARVLGRRKPLDRQVVDMSTINVEMRNSRMKRDVLTNLRFPTYREGIEWEVSQLLAREE